MMTNLLDLYICLNNGSSNKKSWENYHICRNCNKSKLTNRKYFSEKQYKQYKFNQNFQMICKECTLKITNNNNIITKGLLINYINGNIIKNKKCIQYKNDNLLFPYNHNTNTNPINPNLLSIWMTNINQHPNQLRYFPNFLTQTEANKIIKILDNNE